MLQISSSANRYLMYHFVQRGYVRPHFGAEWNNDMDADDFR